MSTAFRRSDDGDFLGSAGSCAATSSESNFNIAQPIVCYQRLRDDAWGKPVDLKVYVGREILRPLDLHRDVHVSAAHEVHTDTSASSAKRGRSLTTSVARSTRTKV